MLGAQVGEYFENADLTRGWKVRFSGDEVAAVFGSAPPGSGRRSDLELRVEAELGEMCAEALTLFERGTDAIHGSIFEPGGKLLRPRLLLLSASAGEPDWGRARRAALAIELLHTGTLYHDDVVDRSAERRGQPAVHRRLGEPAAAFGGAHLLCLGNLLAAEFPDPVARWWGRAMLDVAEGQLRETEHAGSLDLSPAAYERIARRKTATLFELAARIGAYLAGRPPAEQDAFRRFGADLGVAFQLLDDLDDFATQPGVHRPPATDVRERIYTLPVLFACAREDAKGRRLRVLLRDDGRPLAAPALAEACRLLAETGAFAAAAERARWYLDRAHGSLVALPASAARDALAALTSNLQPPNPVLIGGQAP